MKYDKFYTEPDEHHTKHDENFSLNWFCGADRFHRLVTGEQLGRNKLRNQTHVFVHGFMLHGSGVIFGVHTQTHALSIVQYVLWAYEYVRSGRLTSTSQTVLTDKCELVLV